MQRASALKHIHSKLFRLMESRGDAVLHGSRGYTFLPAQFRPVTPSTDADIIIPAASRLEFEMAAREYMYQLTRVASQYGPVAVAGPIMHAQSNRPFSTKTVEDRAQKMQHSIHRTPANPALAKYRRPSHAHSTVEFNNQNGSGGNCAGSAYGVTGVDDVGCTYKLFVCGVDCVDISFVPLAETMVAPNQDVVHDGTTYNLSALSEHETAVRLWEVAQDPANWRCEEAARKIALFGVLERTEYLPSRTMPLWSTAKEWSDFRERARMEQDASKRMGARAATQVATHVYATNLKSLERRVHCSETHHEKVITNAQRALAHVSETLHQLRADNETLKKQLNDARRERNRAQASLRACQHNVNEHKEQLEILRCERDNLENAARFSASHASMVTSQHNLLVATMKGTYAGLQMVANSRYFAKHNPMEHALDHIKQHKLPSSRRDEFVAGVEPETPTEPSNRTNTVLKRIYGRVHNLASTSLTYELSDDSPASSDTFPIRECLNTNETMLELFLVCAVDEWFDRFGGLEALRYHALQESSELGPFARCWINQHITYISSPSVDRTSDQVDVNVPLRTAMHFISDLEHQHAEHLRTIAANHVSTTIREFERMLSPTAAEDALREETTGGASDVGSPKGDGDQSSKAKKKKQKKRRGKKK